METGTIVLVNIPVRIVCSSLRTGDKRSIFFIDIDCCVLNLVQISSVVLPYSTAGPHATAVLGYRCDSSNGGHMRMTDLVNTCGVGSRDHVVYWSEPAVTSIWCYDPEMSRVYL
jgi:hypothetical protein